MVDEALLKKTANWSSLLNWGFVGNTWEPDASVDDNQDMYISVEAIRN